MGYTTDFDGVFTLDRPLSDEHKRYLRRFVETRRMARNPEIAATLSDPERIAVGLPIGEEACFFVGGSGFRGQTDDASVIAHNKPPAGQPGLWCQWVPTDDGTGIAWDGGEKFYAYVEWITYIVAKFLKPWGYVLNGEVLWQGEDSGDFGKIVVTDNEVAVKQGRKVYDD